MSGTRGAKRRDGRDGRESRNVLVGRTVVLSGGVHGIGGALAARLGAAGANVVLLTRSSRGADTAELLRAVEAVDGGGGQCMVLAADLRDEAEVSVAVAKAVSHFGGIDACVNNGSALSLAGTEEIPLEAFDLMVQVNIRGTFVLTRACLPELRRSDNPHVLTISPPLNLAPRWLGAHPPYTLSKYGLTVLALGWAAEFADTGIASNCLWPERAVTTESVVHMMGEDAHRFARSPAVMADAAVEVLASPASLLSGHCLLDVDVLRNVGIADLGQYGGEGQGKHLFIGS